MVLPQPSEVERGSTLALPDLLPYLKTMAQLCQILLLVVQAL